MRKAVIGREFRTGGDARLGIELHSAIRDPYEDVRLAGMIDEVERSSADFSVDRPIVVHFDNRNPFLLFRSSPRFSNRDSLSRKFAQFGSGAHR